METSGDNGIDFRHPELWDTPDRIRRELVNAMSHIYRHGMTTTSGGNLSVADGLGNIWITPSGTDKGSMKPGDVVCVAPDGTFEGLHRPSMEYPLHRAVFNARPDLTALIHAHPPVLTSFSIVHRIPDTSVVHEWQELCGPVGYAAFAVPGSISMGELVAPEFSKGHNTVIMENHAVIVGGRNLAEALARLETLEYCAGAIHAAGYREGIVMPGDSRQEHPDRTAGGRMQPPGPELPLETVGSILNPEEEQLAEEICVMAVRACDRGLMYGFSGTVSARSDGGTVLVTPGNVLRCSLVKDDIVPCRGGEDACPGEERLHSEIYQMLPSVRAVITARPRYLMAFAISGRPTDVRTIPESWLLLRELPALPSGTTGQDHEPVLSKLAEGFPAVLIGNDAVLVTGESLLQAFDRLEVAEMTARSLVIGESLGFVSPISNGNIEKLRIAFGIKG